MSMTRTGGTRQVADHFEPDTSLDAQAQRRLRGHLEQIDYTAYASNREVIAQALGSIDLIQFQRLAVAAAHARAAWIKTGIDASQSGGLPSPDQVARLTELRTAYQELTEVHNAMRRLVERDYLPYGASPFRSE